jgi:hypothetical protein
MLPLLKAALAWILVLALPLQTLAAATMLHCAAGSAPQAAAAMPEHAGHSAAAAHGQAADNHAGMQHDDGTAAEDAHQCSACAACVAGAALPSSVVTRTPPVPASEEAIAPLLREANVVLAPLERPPRSVLG